MMQRGTVVHPDLGAVNYELTQVSDDPDTQVSDVIGIMSRYACEDSGSISPDVIQAAVTGDALTDTWNYLSRFHGSRGMQFVRDEKTANQCSLGIQQWNPVVETLIRPVDEAGLAAPFGDCDDFAMYGAAHLLALGVPCSFVTVAAMAENPAIYSHVYLVAYPNSGPYAGERVALDLSHGSHLGWEVANMFGKRKEWPVKTAGFWPLLFLVAIGLGVWAWGLKAMR